MTLQPPQIDRRTFQDLVDEAKRRIPHYVPEWTDHNLSDPGVALIELFAWMTEQIIYRLNQVPDDIYLRFLELLGLSRFPSIAAHTDLVFMLSAPAEERVTVPAGTEVSTDTVDGEDPIVFMTNDELQVVLPELSGALTGEAGREGSYRNQWDQLRFEGESVICFSTLEPGDGTYLGFDNSLASMVIRLDVGASTEGVGVRPEDPPWTWQVWDGEKWEDATILSDTTGGLNKDGEIVLQLPHVHEPLTLQNQRLHWLRCLLIEPRHGQPAYRRSPEITTLEVSGIGGAVPAHHGELHPRELLGTSEGEPGQVFYTINRPILERRPDETVEVVEPDAGPTTWTEVESFSGLDADSLGFVWDGADGSVRFGPRVLYPDGTPHQFGAIPPRGADIYLTEYRSGGGARGNVGRNTLTVMQTALPFIASVSNPEPATGGVDAETIENARARGAMTLRSGDRAVTAADFERLTLQAAPSVARASVVAPQNGAETVRLLIVPRVEKSPVELIVSDMNVSDELFHEVREFLNERRILGTAITVDTPSYIGVSIAAQISVVTGPNPDLVRHRATEELYRYLSPLTGGPDGAGWPFEQEVTAAEIINRLSDVRGVARVDAVSLFTADLESGQRTSRALQRIEAPTGTLFMSVKHRVV